MNMLLFAIQFAWRCHDGQVDKVGQPFIGHPLRVMARCDREVEAIVAVLHDVVEDTPMSVDGLRSLFSPEVVEAVDAMTKRPDETYRQYITRLAHNPLAAKIKLLDIEDNSDPRRGWAGVPTSRYEWATTYLRGEKPD